jgi:hypothetical protein
MSGRGRAALLVGVAAISLMLLGSVGENNKKETKSEESRLEEICSLTEGTGECRVMISYGGDGQVEAVAVLCDGAESARVRERLTSLVCSLYGIGSHRVEILKISRDGE